jgi:tetratricopeptide (TPR) repeat protein
MLTVVGCGSSAQVANQRETAGEAYAAGVAAFESRDFATAADKLTAAIDAHGLNPDQYANAFLKRAVAAAATDDFETASADLDILERGAPNLDEVYAARAFVLLKQGKGSEAKAAFAKARQLNPRVQPIRE